MEGEARKNYSGWQLKSHWQERVGQKRSYAEWDSLRNQEGKTAKRRMQKRSYAEWDSFSNQEGKTTKRRRFISSSHSLKSTEEMASPFGDITSKFTSEQIADNLRKEIKSLHRSQSLSFDANCSSECSSSVNGSNLAASSCVDQSLFSWKQIELICEKMLKEREKEMRAECDRILHDKLADQHDMFVKFTFDAIQKRNDNCIPSYFS